MISAIIISIFIGSTEDGYNVNSFDIAMAKTASTSHVKHMTKHKNIILILLFITFEEMSAIDFPFSFILLPNSVLVIKNGVEHFPLVVFTSMKISLPSSSIDFISYPAPSPSSTDVCITFFNRFIIICSNEISSIGIVFCIP